MDYNQKRSAIELPIVISCRWRILISPNIKTGSIGRDISNYFSGDYDGNGYVIKNLKSKGYQYGGLFGMLQPPYNSAGIRKGLHDITLVNADVDSVAFAGGVVAYADSYYG